VVRYFDYRPEYRALKDEIDDAIARVLESGRLILGPEVEGLEREFADYAGVTEAIGLNSGTDALILALRAQGIGRGDEVLTVANAGVPPVAAIRAVGATPTFVDVLPGTLLMDASKIEGALTPRTRCIIPVHLYGQPAEILAVLEAARRNDLRVVEDCAQAHGARYRGRHVGSFGDVGCFSFYPTKNLGALGDGGLCVTSDAALAAELRRQRMYGFDGDRHAHSEGLNSRLDEVQAAVLRVKLRHLEANLEGRRALAQRYRDGLPASACAPLELAADVRHAYHLFVVRAPRRERLLEHLRARGIGFGLHYPEPVHRMQAYAFLGVGPDALPVTERSAEEVLSLPLYPGLAEGAVDRVIEALGDFGRTR
jgi:dTDP-4-amino-4,6-dideoxygalactose transaminase